MATDYVGQVAGAIIEQLKAGTAPWVKPCEPGERFMPYNPTTGNAEIWKLQNGGWAGSVNVGPHPLGWTPRGVADFDKDGTSDVLWFNADTGNVEIWQISNGGWAGSVNIGLHPLGWTPAGVGDINRDGVSDVLWHETNTNRVEGWLLSNS